MLETTLKGALYHLSNIAVARPRSRGLTLGHWTEWQNEDGTFSFVVEFEYYHIRCEVLGLTPEEFEQAKAAYKANCKTLYPYLRPLHRLSQKSSELHDARDDEYRQTRTRLVQRHLDDHNRGLPIEQQLTSITPAIAEAVMASPEMQSCSQDERIKELDERVRELRLKAFPGPVGAGGILNYRKQARRAFLDA